MPACRNSLFGAVAELKRESALPAEPTSDNLAEIGGRLKQFLEILEDEEKRAVVKQATDYYDAARSASNDAGPRSVRIAVMKRVLKGEDFTKAPR